MSERWWSWRVTCGVLNLGLVAFFAWLSSTAFAWPWWAIVAGSGMVLAGCAMGAQVFADREGPGADGR